jgi:hypothetical protein
MRIFFVTFVLACAALWMVADLFSGDGGAIRVADTAPAPGTAVRNDAVQPLVKRGSGMTALEEEEKWISQGVPDWEGIPDNLRRDLLASAERLKRNPCDWTAMHKLGKAVEAIREFRHMPMDAPILISLKDDKGRNISCSR